MLCNQTLSSKVSFQRQWRPFSAATARECVARVSRRGQCCLAVKSEQQAEATEQPRRLVLLQAAAAIGLLVTQPAYSQTVCADKDTEEEGDVCRANILKGDKQLDYSKVSGKRGGNTTGGVPVSVLDSEYGRSTAELAGEIDAYFTLDVYDKQRIPLIKSLKGDATNWVSKYARGGSVRSKSARTMYNALDAITGHLASNGLAPFPAGKMKKVRDNVDQALAFLAEGN